MIDDVQQSVRPCNGFPLSLSAVLLEDIFFDHYIELVSGVRMKHTHTQENICVFSLLRRLFA